MVLLLMGAAGLLWPLSYVLLFAASNGLVAVGTNYNGSIRSLGISCMTLQAIW